MTKTQPIFLYFRFLPRTVKVFVSHELSPLGQPKAKIKNDDPHATLARTALDAFIGCAKTLYPHGVHSMNVPRVVEEMRRYVFLPREFEKIVYLPKNATYGERIMICPRQEV